MTVGRPGARLPQSSELWSPTGATMDRGGPCVLPNGSSPSTIAATTRRMIDDDHAATRMAHVDTITYDPGDRRSSVGDARADTNGPETIDEGCNGFELRTVKEAMPWLRLW